MAYASARHLRPAAVAVGIAVVAFGLVLNGAVTSTRALRAIDDFGQAGAAALAAAACGWRALGAHGRWRSSWTLVAAGLTCWAAGEAVWSYYEVVARREVPFPSPADVGFLLFPVLALAGLLVRPSAAFGGRGRIRVVLDGAMVAASLFVLTWLTSLGGVFHAGAADRFSFVVSLAYPASDFILLTVAILVLIHGTVRAGLLVFILGLVLLAIADSGFAYLTTKGSYSTGAFVDIAWFAGFLVIGLSALMAQPEDGGEQARVESPISLALPYLTLVLATGWQVYSAMRGGIDVVAQLVTRTALVALVVRQFLVVLDNRRLTRDVLAQRAELSHRAFHDPLTGLANRALFYDRVTHALELHRRDMRPVTVVFADLDDFKAVNDLHGHDVGDAVLIAVAQRLSAAVRPGDTIARLGGDEFAVLVEDDGDSTMLGIRLLDSMAVPIPVGSKQISLTASIGTTTLGPEHVGTDISSLLKQADVAMYAAKRDGKGQTVRYASTLHDESVTAGGMDAALVAAVQDGAIDTVFQPIVLLDTDEVLAYEALARWRYAGGPVAPDSFIPVAERLGVLGELDLLMVRRCLDRARVGVDMGQPMTFTANVGITRFDEDGLVGRLGELLAECGVPAGQLIIEICERDMVDAGAAMRVTGALRDLGVGVAIDDFGVGWSNLSRLDALRPDIVKLDRSFVAPLEEKSGARKLLAGVIDLAHDLGAVVIGEGVETLGQLEVLRELGCDAAQGFLIGRPATWVDGDAAGPRPVVSRRQFAGRTPADAA